VSDVAIVGGGPAGATLAIALGQRGVRVALYEQARRPHLKPCGEGLLPHGVAALSEIAGDEPEAPRVRGLRFVAGRTEVEADFPDGHGLIVRRDRFDAWLLDRAGATPNVDVRQGVRYRPAGERFVVGADGKRSVFHRQFRARPATLQRVGLSSHVGGLEGLGDRVEVFFHVAGELYVAPTGGGEAIVTGLFHRRSFRRDGIPYLLGAIPALRERAARIEWTTPMLACAPLGLVVPRIVGPGILLIGDAAGAPDPITGDGIAMAIASARPAADAIVSGDLRAYERTRQQMGRTADRLAAALLAIARASDQAMGLLLSRRSLVPTLLDVATGRQRFTVATALRAFR